jgi:hypothetical protein
LKGGRVRFCVRSARVSTRSSQKEGVKQDLKGGLLFLAAESQTKATIAVVRDKRRRRKRRGLLVCATDGTLESLSIARRLFVAVQGAVTSRKLVKRPQRRRFNIGSPVGSP